MAAENTVISMDFARRRRDEARGASRLFSIKEVGDHCGLPGSVIMQLVPRLVACHDAVSAARREMTRG
jgi:hypothetical protein